MPLRDHALYLKRPSLDTRHVVIVSRIRVLFVYFFPLLHRSPSRGRVHLPNERIARNASGESGLEHASPALAPEESPRLLTVQASAREM
jgi:hypothetical protein